MTKLFKKAQDPWSFMTHYLGAWFSGIALILCTIQGIKKGDTLEVMISVLIFSVSLILLYSASATYHYFKENEILRKWDHAMIYALIAGTYTPIALHVLPEGNGMKFVIVLWVVALLGIIVKICWLNAPRVLSTAFYLAMGWAVIFDFKAFLMMPTGCLVLVTLGGISYTIGAVIYAIKKPNLNPEFGFHELFHIFVLLGSLCHFLAIYHYIL